MPQTRTLTPTCNGRTDVLYVVGTQLSINLYSTAPVHADCCRLDYSPNVKTNFPKGAKIPLNKDSVLLVSMSQASAVQGDGKVTIIFMGSKEGAIAELIITAVEISLDVDANRDGQVEKSSPHKALWKWGPTGYGAILLVNCDSKSGKTRDCDKRYIGTEDELKDMSQMVLRTAGPEKLPEGHRLLLHMSASDAEGAQVFFEDKDPEETYYPLVLASGRLSGEVDYTKETTFYVRGVKFANPDFSGLIQIHVSLVEQGSPETAIFTDTVQFKTAPWIMTPNTSAPVKVFVCKMKENQVFVKMMRELAEKAQCQLEVIEQKISRLDPWIQDEIEFGYVQAPCRGFPVVLESPRNRELQNFPYNQLLGPEFGYVTRHPPRDQVTSLESFGNLDVSPPVTANGKKYPLGRIYLGGALPFQKGGRHMTKMIRNFLQAQAVQEPIFLFTDWLLVGHVDEFSSIVPVDKKEGKKDFRLLLASPHAAYKLAKGLQCEGHGDAMFFDGAPDPKRKRVTVNELLANETMFNDNNYYQRCIDWNRDHLKKELGLDEDDIVDIPVLYKSQEKKALAFFPDIVNMIVLGKNLGIPKPYGPKVNGQCAIEQEVTRLLEPLGCRCTFIDDFVTYHEQDGEVHCGSNVLRKGFDLKWWEMEM